MKWTDTVASKCRYGDVAAAIFGDAEVIWESSQDDYQGYANVFARKPDGSFVHYEWSYGSCSGCDEWEARSLGDDEIEAEMRRAMAVLKDVAAAKRYLKLEDEFADAKVPTANSATNGSVPAMLRILTGGVGDDFKRLGEAFQTWLAQHEQV